MKTRTLTTKIQYKDKLEHYTTTTTCISYKNLFIPEFTHQIMRWYTRLLYDILPTTYGTDSTYMFYLIRSSIYCILYRKSLTGQ